MSNRASVFFLLAAVGLVAPWIFNAQYFLSGGSVLPGAFFGAAFANSLTTAITLDVYIAAIVFSVWVFVESKRVRVARSWLYVVLTFFVGLSFALPLYLGMRERALVSPRT
jgi:Terpene cyclase DEP1